MSRGNFQLPHPEAAKNHTVSANNTNNATANTGRGTFQLPYPEAAGIKPKAISTKTSGGKADELRRSIYAGIGRVLTKNAIWSAKDPETVLHGATWNVSEGEKKAARQRLDAQRQEENRRARAGYKYAGRDKEATQIFTNMNENALHADTAATPEEREYYLGRYEQNKADYGSLLDRTEQQQRADIETAKGALKEYTDNGGGKMDILGSRANRGTRAELEGNVATAQQELNNTRAERYFWDQANDVADIEAEIVGTPEYAAALAQQKMNALTEGKSNGKNVGQFSQEGEKQDRITPEQRAIMQVLAANGDERLETYHDYVNRQANAAIAAEQEQWLKDHPGMRLPAYLAGSFTSGASLLGAAAGALDNKYNGYRPVDLNSSIYAGARIEGTAQELMTAGIDNSFTRFLADTGLSMMNFASKLPLGPMALAFMATDSAGMTAYDSLERGATPEQALANGVVAGAAEALAERLPLKNLFRIASSGNAALLSREGVRQILKQSGIEATEEAATQYVQVLSDIVTMGSNSQWAQARRAYMEQGMSKREATIRANVDMFIVEPLAAAAGGWLSGGVMGTAATTYSGGVLSQDTKANINQRREQRAIEKEARREAKAEEKAAEAEQTEAGKTREQIIKEYQNSTDDGILAFIKKIRSLKDSKVAGKLKHKISPVGDKQANDLHDLLGGNYTGFTNIFRGDGIQHIDIRHGINGKQDQSMADDADIARISYVLKNYDSIEILRNEKGEAVLDNKALNADGSPAYHVLMEKRIDGTFYLVEAVPDNASKQFIVKSAYIKQANKKEAPQVLELSDETGRQLTPKTLPASTSNDTIAQPAEEVNGAEYSMETDVGDAGYGEGGIEAMSEEDEAERFRNRVKEERNGQDRGESQERAAGVDTRGEAGRVADQAGTDSEGRVSAEQGRGREDRFQNIERVSAADIGVENGTGTKSIQIVYAGIQTEEERGIAADNAERGLATVFFRGQMELERDGHILHPEALIQGNTIFLGIDYDYTKNNLHEQGHKAVRKDPAMVKRLKEQLRNRYSEEELRELVDSYMEDYAGSGVTAEEIYEEILCDVHAGLIDLGAEAKAQVDSDIAAAESRAAEAETTRGPPEEGQKFKIKENDKNKVRPITKDDLHDLRKAREKVSVKSFTSYEIEMAQKWAARFWQELSVKSPFFTAWFGEWRVYDTSPVRVVDIPPNLDVKGTYKKQQGTYKNGDTMWDIRVSKDGLGDTISHSGSSKRSVYGLVSIKELVENAVLLDTETHEMHGKYKIHPEWNDVAFNHKLYSLGRTQDGAVGLYRITVEDAFKGRNYPSDKRFHHLRYIEKVADLPAGALAREVQNMDDLRSDGTASGASTTKYTVAELYEFVKKYDPEFTSGQEVVPEMLNEDGTPKVLYHQTGKDINVFDPSHPGAGTYDSETPSGIFLKPTADDIGVGGDMQMALYASIRKPLTVADRQELSAWYRKHVPGYTEAADAIRAIDERYEPVYDSAEKRGDDWYQENYDDFVSGKISDEEVKHILNDELDEILAQWTSESNVARAKAKQILNDYFAKSDYDGVHIIRDQGSFGRSVETWIAFKPSQVKSVTDNVGTFNRNNLDIHYKLPPKSGQEVTAQKEAPRRTMSKADKAEDSGIRSAVNKIGDILSIPNTARRTEIRPVLERLAEEYKENGRVDPAHIDTAFEEAYEQGLVIDEDYYNQYKDVKQLLRDTAVTISEGDASNIGDYGLWRRRHFGKLRIVKQGGEPVDSFYTELSGRYPELFPPSLTHPSDQLQQMGRVANDITRAGETLDDHYGAAAETFKAYAKNDFDLAIADMIGDVARAEAWRNERTAREETKKAKAKEEPWSFRSALKIWKALKEAQRNADRVSAKTLLLEADRRAVDGLLKGYYTEDTLPDNINRRAVLEVYKAKKEREDLSAIVKEMNENRKAALRAEAAEFLKTSDDWQDKKVGILYSRETMERNVRDIIKDPKLADAIIKNYFAPVHANEAARTRLKNEYRERIRQLNISQKIEKGNAASEAYAVQFLGEARSALEYLKDKRPDLKNNGWTYDEWETAYNEFMEANPDLDMEHVDKCIAEFRNIYDELYEMINKARVRNGYAPVDYRHGYFPHFSEDGADSILGKMGQALGIRMDVQDLPTDIAGLTHTFRPGIRWEGHLLERIGNETAYDALAGFDKYIEGISDIIFHTDDIQRLRALANEIRYKYSSDGVKAKVDEIRNSDLSPEEKDSLIEEAWGTDRTSLSNFVINLEEYTNLLANKKAFDDRSMERKFGRRAYNICKALENRVAANMVAVNPGSWLTNFIPISQGAATLKNGALLRGLFDTIKAMKTDDGFWMASDFLTNRRGSDLLALTKVQKAAKIASSGMEIIDRITASTMVRARYYQNMQEGLSEAAAMEEADAWTADLMADRSKGALPTMFEAKNPLRKLFTMFQVEVNNQLSFLFKDMPREVKKRGKAALALALLKYCIGAFLFDDLYELLVGRRAALDPLNMLNEFVGDVTGYELPNTFAEAGRLISGQASGEDFRTEKEGLTAAGLNLVENLGENVPFVGGVFFEGGRIPISSALPDLEKIWKAGSGLITGDMDKKKAWSDIGKEMLKPGSYIAPPFGGGQAKKIYQGLSTVLKGGSYSYDKDGNRILQYPVYNDNAFKEAINILQAVTFGKTALSTGREWIENDFKSLSARETAAYIELVAGGSDARDVYETLTAMKAEEKSIDKRAVLMEADLSDAEKFTIYSDVLYDEDDKKPDQISDIMIEGISFNDAMLIQNRYSIINSQEDMNAGAKAMEFRKWLDDNYYDDSQQAVITEAFKFWQQIPAETKTYDKLTDDYGMDSDSAYRLSTDFAALQPLPGNDEVKEVQKYRAIVDAPYLTAYEKVQAFKSVGSGSVGLKAETINYMGVDLAAWVSYQEIRPNYVKEGSTYISAAGAEAAIRSLHLDNTTSAVLWQMATVSWKPRNNPFSTSVGARAKAYYDEINEG